MPTTLEKKKAVSVGPFVIEADHPRMADLEIQSIINGRMRSKIKAVKEVFAREEGEQVVRPSPAGMIPGLPANIPGMQLHVNPAELTWKIIDPLRDDEETLEKIQRAIRNHSGLSVKNKLKGVPPREGKVDKDRMKTLVREVFNLLKNHHAKLVKGMSPNMEDIDDLPGDYLLNARSEMDFRQPRLEKDLESWVRQLNRMGD